MYSWCSGSGSPDQKANQVKTEPTLGHSLALSIVVGPHTRWGYCAGVVRCFRVKVNYSDQLLARSVTVGSR